MDTTTNQYKATIITPSRTVEVIIYASNKDEALALANAGYGSRNVQKIVESKRGNS